MAIPTVIASSLVSRGSPVSSPLDVAEPEFWLRAGWGEGVMEVRSSWTCTVNASRGGSEHRRLRTDRPIIGTNTPFLGMEQGDMARARMIARQMGRSRFLWPLWNETIAPTSIGSERTVTIDEDGLTETNYAGGSGNYGSIIHDRRFFAGGRVLLWDRADVESWAVRTLSTVTPTGPTRTLAWDSPFTGFPSSASGIARYAVTPLIEANLMLDSGYSAVTRRLAQGGIEATEWPGPQALSVRVEPGSTSDAVQYAGLVQFGSLPVFPIEIIDWNTRPTTRYRRAGSLDPVGMENVPLVYEDRARRSDDFAVQCLNRRQYAKLRAIWEYGGGRTYPFWFISTSDDHEFVSQIDSTTVRVRAVGPSSAWSDVPFVGIVYRDGTYSIARVSSVARTGSEYSGYDQLTLGEAVPVKDIARVNSAFIARFRSDELTERWSTFEVCGVTVGTIEIADDEDQSEFGIIVNIADKSDEMDDLSDRWSPDECAALDVPCEKWVLTPTNNVGEDILYVEGDTGFTDGGKVNISASSPSVDPCTCYDVECVESDPGGTTSATVTGWSASSSCFTEVVLEGESITFSATSGECVRSFQATASVSSCDFDCSGWTAVGTGTWSDGTGCESQTTGSGTATLTYSTADGGTFSFSIVDSGGGGTWSGEWSSDDNQYSNAGCLSGSLTDPFLGGGATYITRPIL
jgi:hypothetical protein